MPRTIKYLIPCPQCHKPDRVMRKGSYPSKGPGYFRLVCKSCKVTFTRLIEAEIPNFPPLVPKQPASGEDHSQAKLSNRQVLDIVTLNHSGSSIDELANRFGVSKASIRGILCGDTWQNVTGITPEISLKLPKRYKVGGR